MKRSLVLLPLMCLLLGCTINRVAEDRRTITATGRTTSDIFATKHTLDFLCITGGWSAAQISQDNDAIIARFLEKVRALGVENPDIESAAVCTITNPGQSYEARKSVKITVRDEKKIPLIVDCKTTSIRFLGESYEFDEDMVANLRRERTAAIQNASEVAALEAGAAGARLGLIRYIGKENVTLNDKDAQKTGKKTMEVTVEVAYDLVQ